MPITDARVRRFMITLELGVELVWHAFDDTFGGEIYVKKICSMQVTDNALAVDPEAPRDRQHSRGRKLHEQMASLENAAYTSEYEGYYEVLPAVHEWGKGRERINSGKSVTPNVSHSSNNNAEWMSIETLRAWIAVNRGKISLI